MNVDIRKAGAVVIYLDYDGVLHHHDVRVSPKAGIFRERLIQTDPETGLSDPSVQRRVSARLAQL
jgi:hypothetical protein